MWESKIYEQMQESAVLQSNHITGSHAGGKTCLYMYFGGAKALFSYINLQITVEGGKTMQNLSSGGTAARVSLQVRACSKDSIMLFFIFSSRIEISG